MIIILRGLQESLVFLESWIIIYYVETMQWVYAQGLFRLANCVSTKMNSGIITKKHSSFHLDVMNN